MKTEAEFITEIYLALQKQARLNMDVALATDSIRASLRDRLTDLTGLTGQQVQEEIEYLAFVSEVKPQIKNEN